MRTDRASQTAQSEGPLVGQLPCCQAAVAARAGDRSTGTAAGDHMGTMAPVDAKTFQVTLDSWHEPDGLHQA